MSLTRARLAATGLLVALLAAPTAWAQGEDGALRERDGGGGDAGGELRGSLTSTTFAAREISGEATPLSGGAQAPHESTATRLFTDIRARLDRDQLAGMDVHADLRLRLTGSAIGLSNANLQSGLYGGPEYDIRQLYATRAGGSTDFRFGRQVVGELAATRIDGVRLTHRASDNWQYLGFAGLYPARGSRSITTDYVRSVEGFDANTREPIFGSPVLPVTAGGGTSYRYDRLYGSLGAVGIVPLADDRATGELETPRVFFTSNGYWRQSLNLDLFHHAVVDAMGAAGAGLTNLHVGANARPSEFLRVSAAVTRVDTETLNVIAQRRLRDRVDEGATDSGLIQNYLQVARIAQESARLGVSAALAERRYEISTIGTLRRRPEVQLEERPGACDPAEDGLVCVLVPGAQAMDVTLQAVDRRAPLDMRLEASVTEVFGLGGENLNRGRSRIARVKGSRPFSDGQGTFELAATYLNSADEFRGDACISSGAVLRDLDRCYGTSNLHAGTLGALAFYRINGSWMALGGLELGLQRLTTVRQSDDDRDVLVDAPQPPIMLTTAFGRVSYRF
jgi:hypothetical protein